MPDALPDTMTLEERYAPAMLVETPEAARAWLGRLVERYLRVVPDATREEAEDAQLHNIAYFAGYFDPDVRARVERLYGRPHPYYGSVNDPPKSADELFRIGAEMAAARTIPFRGRDLDVAAVTREMFLALKRELTLPGTGHPDPRLRVLRGRAEA